MTAINMIGLLLTFSGMSIITFGRAAKWFWARRKRHRHLREVEIGTFLMMVGFLLQLVAAISLFLDDLKAR